jgi:phytoene dehydrogenase-like protein
MIYDAIIIGAGFGGLSCASLLAKKGKKVLLLEKSLHCGGTSSVFSRKGYLFPMGPLGFSQPQRILDFLDEIGISKKPTFKRNHYQLMSPSLECIYSTPFEELREELRHFYPKESRIDDFFDKLSSITSEVKDLHRWHPDYLLDGKTYEHRKSSHNSFQKNLNSISAYASTPGKEILDRYFSDVKLKNFLGSMGTDPPRMSLLNLAVMWHLMAEIGIWFPSGGMHGLIHTIENAFIAFGGEIRFGQSVQKILLKGGKAAGVKTSGGEVFESHWVVSNADTKKTFLELVDEGQVSSTYLKKIQRVPYTDSELCVYLGLDPMKVDWKAMKARHLFYRHKFEPGSRSELTDFANREISITLWSDNMENLTPPQKKSLVLRVGFPFSHFSDFWMGEKKRRPEYQEYKNRLAEEVVQAAEKILPGLSSSIEAMEAATPLTYQDWGNRFQGSLAGWTWGAKNKHITGNKLLIRTPIPNLLMAGIYAASELFLGGVPTAVHTGCLAARFICKKKGTAPC